MTDDVTQDFIFGTLATDDLRLAALRAEAQRVSHRHRMTPADPEPGQPVRLHVGVGPEVNAAEVVACYTTDGGDPTPNSRRIAFKRGEIGWDTLLWAYRCEWHGTLPPQPEGTLVRYRVVARTVDGYLAWADPDAATGAPETFAYHVDRARVPDWIRDAVIYHVFVDRFFPGEGRAWNDASTLGDIWGGTLRGIVEQLPYLEALGVTCLWLSPVFPSPSHHGYDATDYFTVEPRLGTDADLSALFEAAHARGMRVLLDYVANHVSNEHPAFRRAVADPTAPERAWFTFTDWPDEYCSFFGVKTLPRLDTDHPAARDYLLAGAVHWLRRGADGFRLDYANGPPHGFWAAFRAATRATKPDAVTVGEVVETAELQRSYRGRLDGTLDYLLLQQLRAFIAFETISASAFDAFLRRHLAYFPDDFVLPSFLDNHDMNRFLWVVQGDVRRLKLAALCQFTLPHTPIIYYGTEIGLSQRHDIQYPDGSRRLEESRTLMPWGEEQDPDLLSFYRTLVAARRGRPGLWRGERSTLAETDGGLYAVQIDGAGRSAVVALNRGRALVRIDVPAGQSLALATDAGVQHAAEALTLPPLTGALLLS